jgi:hypothetical protein
MVLDLLGRRSAEHKERGVLNRPGSESADSGRVGGETPPTRDLESYLFRFEKQRKHRCPEMGQVILTHKVHLFFRDSFLFCSISI